MPTIRWKSNFCANVRYLRRREGLSRTAMAKQIGVTGKTLDAFEAGEIPPRSSVRVLFNISRAFGVDPDLLVGARLEDG